MMAGTEGPSRPSADGRFRLVARKQDGHVCFTALNRDVYKRRRLDDFASDDTAVETDGTMWAVRADVRFHAAAPIKASDRVDQIVLKVEKAAKVTGVATSASGKRTKNLRYLGRSDGFPRWHDAEDGQLVVYDMEPQKPRAIAVICEGGKLAGATVLKNPEDGFSVKLQPWATITGRIVDEQGEPLANANIHRAFVAGASPAGAFGFSAEKPIGDMNAFLNSIPLPPAPRDSEKKNVQRSDQDGCGWSLHDSRLDPAACVRSRSQPSAVGFPVSFESNCDRLET